jgi:hypothetical protein
MADEFDNRDNNFLLTRVTYDHFRGNYFCGDYNPHTLFQKSIKGTTIYVLDGWHSLNTVPIIMPEGRDGLSISYVRVITVFTVFRLLTDFVCLYNYEF